MLGMGFASNFKSTVDAQALNPKSCKKSNTILFQPLPSLLNLLRGSRTTGLDYPGCFNLRPEASFLSRIRRNLSLLVWF